MAKKNYIFINQKPVRKSFYISQNQNEFIKQNKINLSKFIRTKIEEEIKKRKV